MSLKLFAWIAMKIGTFLLFLSSLDNYWFVLEYVFFSFPCLFPGVCFLLVSFAESIAWSPEHFVVLLKKCVQYKTCSGHQYAMWQKMFCPNWINPLSNKLTGLTRCCRLFLIPCCLVCFHWDWSKKVKKTTHVICLSDGGQGGGTRQLLSGVQKAVSRFVQHTVCRKTHRKFQKRRLCWEIKCISQFVCLFVFLQYLDCKK